MKVLFATHKWGDAEPDTGESVTVPHLIDTFHEWNKGQAFVVWTDECYYSKMDVDKTVKEACVQYKPDVVVLTPIPANHLESQNASPECVRSIDCATVSIFFDLADPSARRISKKYADASTLSVNLDGNPEAIGNNYLSLWPARIRRPFCLKVVDVCFVGARRNYPDRLDGLARLRDAGVKVKVLGGRAEDPCTFQEYMDVLDKSWIALNFSKTQGYGKSQIKARVFEALSSRCCLLEDMNETTAQYLLPGVDYLFWRNINELVPTVVDLISDRTKISNIAAQGYSKFRTRYSAYCFWEEIFSALETIKSVGSLRSPECSSHIGGPRIKNGIRRFRDMWMAN